MSERDEWAEAARADMRFQYPTKGRIQDCLRAALRTLDAVEALAAEWEADPDGLPRADGCARELRAALAPASSVPAPESGAGR